MARAAARERNDDGKGKQDDSGILKQTQAGHQEPEETTGSDGAILSGCKTKEDDPAKELPGLPTGGMQVRRGDQGACLLPTLLDRERRPGIQSLHRMLPPTMPHCQEMG